MQTLFRLVMPDEPATHKHAIVLRQKSSGDFVVHWQDVNYALEHGETSSYYHGFEIPDIKTGVAELVRRLQPKLEYHKRRAVDLDGIVELAIAIETLTFCLSQDIANLAAIVDRLNRQVNQPPEGCTWADVAKAFASSSLILVKSDTDDVLYPYYAAILQESGEIAPLAHFKSPLGAMQYILETKTGRKFDVQS